MWEALLPPTGVREPVLRAGIIRNADNRFKIARGVSIKAKIIKFAHVLGKRLSFQTEAV